jgi:hypothetical protein
VCRHPSRPLVNGELIGHSAEHADRGWAHALNPQPLSTACGRDELPTSSSSASAAAADPPARAKPAATARHPRASSSHRGWPCAASPRSGRPGRRRFRRPMRPPAQPPVHGVGARGRHLAHATHATDAAILDHDGLTLQGPGRRHRVNADVGPFSFRRSNLETSHGSSSAARASMAAASSCTGVSL